MGIRVHKLLGYGLTDVKTNDQGQIIDDRFDELGVVKYKEDAEDIWTQEMFIKYCESHLEYAGLYIDGIKRNNWNIYDSIEHGYEYGLTNVFMIIPPGDKTWSRYDNTIDYVEETEVHRQKNRIVKLQQGIYPYSGIHQNKYGEKLDMGMSCAWWRMYNIVLDGDITQHMINSINLYLHHMSMKLGFENFHDARDNIAPYVPDIVRCFCKWSSMFIDEDTINQLRPLLYVYWG